jgi:uncharacterized membrane protein
VNAAHLHLIFNHIPVIGMLIAVVFFLVSLFHGKDILIKASLWLIFFVALSAVPAYLTGDPAHEYLEHTPGLRHDLIHEHEDAAEVAFVSAMILGLLALLGLVGYRQRRRLSRLYLFLVLLAALVVLALMAGAANQGGKIRHPEVRSASQLLPEGEPGQSVPATPPENEGTADTAEQGD